MSSLPFVTLDVFTTRSYTGNPLAVVFLSRELPTAQKQQIAREFNLSETVFIHPPTSTNAKKRSITIFTTGSEVPFAGHPTIGTASWLLCHSADAEDRGVDTLSMKAGDVPIALTGDDDDGPGVTAEIAHDVRMHAARFPLAEILRLHTSLAPFFPAEKGDVSFPIVSIVNGMSQVHVELPSLAALGAVTTSAGGETISPASWLDEGWQRGLVMVYFFVREGVDSQASRQTIRSRAVLGSLEDPATGSAASGLAAYLSLREGRAGRFGYGIVQGEEMGRRSEIGVEVGVGEGGEVQRVGLRGAAVRVSEGRIRVPE
jgi:PhzF family phenazine biosynthesis protein